jgi:hypothetical protein
MFMRNRDNNSTSSGGYWDEYSDASESSLERHRDPKHRRRTTTQTRKESYTKSISAHPSDEEEDFVQETPEAALVAAQAYLLTIQPKPRDPRGAHASSEPRVDRTQAKGKSLREKGDIL